MSGTNFQNTSVYKKSFEQAMSIFEVSKQFPKEERYSLTDQIRRSSRSVTANVAEAFRKKRYPAHFISKLTDCDGENSETMVWLNFSLRCNYISPEIFRDLAHRNEEVGKLISHMMEHPAAY